MTATGYSGGTAPELHRLPVGRYSRAPLLVGSGHSNAAIGAEQLPGSVLGGES